MTPTARTSTRVYTSPGRDTVLDAVRDLWNTHGHSPSATAVAHHTGLSRRTVRDHLAALEELGHIRRTPGKTRSIVILDGSESPPSPDDLRPFGGVPSVVTVAGRMGVCGSCGEETEVSETDLIGRHRSAAGDLCGGEGFPAIRRAS